VNPSPAPVPVPPHTAQEVPNNAPPTATNQSVTTNQNTSVDITLAGTDSNSNAVLTAHITSHPLYGTLGNINQDTGVVTYTPNQGFTGNDSFTFLQFCCPCPPLSMLWMVGNVYI